MFGGIPGLGVGGAAATVDRIAVDLFHEGLAAVTYFTANDAEGAALADLGALRPVDRW
jgi:hypothetical protein